MKNCQNKDCTQQNPQPTTEFYADKSVKSGLQARCKTCWKARCRAYAEANKDRRNAYQRVYKQTHPQKARKSNIEGKRKWIAANRDKYNAYQREYQRRRKEKEVVLRKTRRSATASGTGPLPVGRVS